MDLNEVLDINRKALEHVRSRTGLVDASDKFFGFFLVDKYESPPFVMFSANDTGVYSDAQYESASMRLWCRLCVVASGIVDIGSHAGLYSLAAASIRPDLEVFAFEPNPYAFARLRLKKTVNAISNIRDMRAALSHSEGVAQLHWVRKPGLPISAGGTIIPIAHVSQSKLEHYVTEVRRLDGVLAVEKIGDRGLIKMDVEGAELSVFRGMQNILDKRSDIILESFSRVGCDAINALLRPLGYATYRIDELAGTLARQDGLTPADHTSSCCNQLLTVRSEAEMSAIWNS